ncbi:zinc finger protein 721-like [Daktulosphaira vitifoliae]|uniref:zinc finger protein 721-like n=1 Tax=Daktulosphaira vitifoliae TaxID=58002 RepID=UPI0021AA8466|nr:zinc finger protein 721-like [Daktulosphaira vitifoliae]
MKLNYERGPQFINHNKNVFFEKIHYATANNGQKVVILPTVLVSKNKNSRIDKVRRSRRRKNQKFKTIKCPIDASRQKVFYIKSNGGYKNAIIKKNTDDLKTQVTDDVDVQESKKGRPKGSKNKNKFDPIGYGLTDKSFVYSVDLNTCVVCNESLDTDLLDHALEHHKDTCPICGEYCSQNLSKHFESHAKQTYLKVKCYECYHCKEKYGNSELLADHVLEVHVKKATQLTCCICGQIISRNTLVALRQHISVAHSDANPSTFPETCGYCNHQPGRNDLIAHLFDKHLSKTSVTMSCTICEAQCDSRSDIVDHMVRTHCSSTTYRRPAVYRCPACHIGFKTQTSVLRHACSAIKNPYCENCDKMFPSKMRLAFHLQFHDHVFYPAMHLRCDVCLVEMEDEYQLYDHIRFQHEVCEKAVCETCGRMFKTSMGLSIHRRYHVGDRHYTCKTCDKSFLNRSTLKEHEISHMEVKPFRCHICGQYLSRASRLRSHVKSHKAAESTSQRCCYCLTCGFVAPNTYLISDHMSKEHDFEGEARTADLSLIVKCEYCDSTYIDSTSLNQHRDNKHPKSENSDAFACALCSSTFSTYSRLTTHKLTHGINTESTLLDTQFNDVNVDQDRFCIPQFFSCEHCGKMCLHYTYLCLHRKLKHSKKTEQVKCSRCPQEFKSSWKLIYHKKTTHGLSPNQETHSEDVHQCKICFRKFSKVGALNLHKTRSHIDNSTSVNAGKYLCDQCGKSLNSERSLINHKKTHSRHIPCLENKQPTTPIITETKPQEKNEDNITIYNQISCPICLHLFDDNLEYIEHLENHTKVENIVPTNTICILCDTDLLDTQMFKYHIEKHSVNKEAIVCYICYAPFHSCQGFLLHVGNVHQMFKLLSEEHILPEISFVGMSQRNLLNNEPLVVDCSQVLDNQNPVELLVPIVTKDINNQNLIREPSPNSAILFSTTDEHTLHQENASNPPENFEFNYPSSSNNVYEQNATQDNCLEYLPVSTINIKKENIYPKNVLENNDNINFDQLLKVSEHEKQINEPNPTLDELLDLIPLTPQRVQDNSYLNITEETRDQMFFLNNLLDEKPSDCATQ